MKSIDRRGGAQRGRSGPASRRSAAGRFARAALAALLLSAGVPAYALCTVVCTCSVAVTGLVFPNYNPLSASPSDTTGSVRVSCGGVAGLLIPYTVALGAGSSNDVAARTMASGGRRLAYNLYLTSSYAAVWGDGTGASSIVNSGVLLDALGLSPAQTWTIYGRVPSRQLGVAPGSYADTVTVTLTYF